MCTYNVFFYRDIILLSPSSDTIAIGRRKIRVLKKFLRYCAYSLVKLREKETL